MIQGKGDHIEDYYESLESWDTEFGKVFIYGRRLPIVGENSFLWSGLLAKSELRHLLDELFEHALEGGPGSSERSRVSEGGFYQR